MKYFSGITNLDDLKNAFRELCKIHHPDLGGDVRIMQEINAEYSRILETGKFDFGQSNVEIEEAIRDIIERATVLDGLVIELCGRWVWFTGNTYKWKEVLKALGCAFASKKKAWYWRPADEAYKGAHKPLELDQIKEKYGAIRFETKQAAALT